MIYALLADTKHMPESDELRYDATLIEFERWQGVSFFDPEVDDHQWLGAPAVIEFVGNLEHAAWLDHICTAPRGFLLISKRMVRVLESVGPFKHRLIPTIIYSESIGHLVRDKFTRRRTWYQVEDPRLRNEDFVILQLREQLDILDGDRTLLGGVPFRHCGREFFGWDDADHLAVRVPEGGLPPVFCTPEMVNYFYSEEAKQACDKAGLKGLWWRPQK